MLHLHQHKKGAVLTKQRVILTEFLCMFDLFGDVAFTHLQPSRKSPLLSHFVDDDTIMQFHTYLHLLCLTYTSFKVDTKLKITKTGCVENRVKPMHCTIYALQTLWICVLTNLLQCTNFQVTEVHERYTAQLQKKKSFRNGGISSFKNAV